MKKNIIGILLLISSCFTLSAMEENIPALWKSSGKENHKMNTFGFSQNNKQYSFMLQIKSLEEICKSDNSMLSIYLDTDNNKNTGRFKKKKGWDFQLNIHLKRRAVSAIVWEEEQIKTTYTFTNGQFSIKTEGDKIIINIDKVYFLKNIKIGKSFILFEEHSFNGKTDKTYMDGIVVKLK